MKAKSTFTGMIVLFILCSTTITIHAQSKGYTDGSVWHVSMIKTKTGMSDEYIKSLKGTLKAMYDEAIKQNLIVSYKIMQGASANREDFEIMILVEYKNYAAFDGHDAQWDAIRDKAIGGEAAEKTLMKNRLDIREIMGEKVMREVIFN